MSDSRKYVIKNIEYIEQVTILIQNDENNEFSNQCVPGSPEINFKTIFILRMVDNKSWESISDSLNIDRYELDGFYKKWVDKLINQIEIV